MRGNVVAVGDRRQSHCGILLDGFSNGVQGVLHAVFIEEAEETPDSSSRPVLIFGLNIDCTLARVWSVANPLMVGECQLRGQNKRRIHGLTNLPKKSLGARIT
jgi:hypothetical protein